MEGFDVNAGSTLLALLREDGASGAPDLPSQAWEAAGALALSQGVAPPLHRRLQNAGTPSAAPATLVERLAAERHAIALDNLKKYGEFRSVAKALSGAGIPVMPLKGLHLAELVYRDISLRPMSDIDILVPRERVADAVWALRAEGFGPDEELGTALAGTLDIKCNVGLAQAERGTWLEVHWALDEPGGAGPGPIDAIWKSARPARLGDADAQVMAPEFLLLHVCAHLACNHAFTFSLRGLCDIAEIVRTQPLDWQLVVTQGLAHPWTRGVAAALRLARDHLGAAVPAEALAALGGDALEPEMLAEALTQLLAATELPQVLITTPNLLALSAMASPWQKLRLLSQRIFVPRAELALLYGVPADSPRLPLYYALRLRDLLRRYASGAWALHAGDPALAATAARHTRLTNWIRKSGSGPQ